MAEPGRLDAVLARMSGVARSDVQRAIASGSVTVDGGVRPRSFRLRGGELIEADLAAAADVPAEGPAVPIRFDDGHLLVIAKPGGLVTHPTRNRRGGTLMNRLMGMGVPLSTAAGPLRRGIVHRLDAGTSGLMLVAKDDETHAALSALLRRHAVERRYLALARGDVEHASFAVDAPLGRRAERVVVDASAGRPAETAFEIVERLARATLLEATPRTGRTHQIRVHLAAIGHPILGDRRYGGAGDDARRLGLDRPFLHSWRIAFDHPITGERIELDEPLPPDLVEALRRAGGRESRPWPPSGESRDQRP